MKKIIFSLMIGVIASLAVGSEFNADSSGWQCHASRAFDPHGTHLGYGENKSMALDNAYAECGLFHGSNCFGDSWGCNQVQEEEKTSDLDVNVDEQ